MLSCALSSSKAPLGPRASAARLGWPSCTQQAAAANPKRAAAPRRRRAAAGGAKAFKGSEVKKIEDWRVEKVGGWQGQNFLAAHTTRLL